MGWEDHQNRPDLEYFARVSSSQADARPMIFSNLDIRMLPDILPQS